MSNFLHHEPCPKCHSKDNLGVWDDGHKHCFGCGYYESGERSLSKEIMGQTKNLKPILAPPIATIADEDYKNNAGFFWLYKYGLTDEEITAYNIYWNSETRQLVLPIYDDSELLAWQARNFPEVVYEAEYGTIFREPKRKYFSQGELDNILFIAPTEGDFSSSVLGESSIVLVEDYVSTIKVGRYQTALCLFGSNLGQNKLKTLSGLFNNIYLWLDPDKAVEASKQANKAQSLGYNVIAFSTEKDPKEHTDEEIQAILQGIK